MLNIAESILVGSGQESFGRLILPGILISVKDTSVWKFSIYRRSGFYLDIPTKKTKPEASLIQNQKIIPSQDTPFEATDLPTAVHMTTGKFRSEVDFKVVIIA